jgi:hypothetical protein
MLPPENASLEQVSRETGLSVGTLKRWQSDELLIEVDRNQRQTAVVRQPEAGFLLTVPQSRLLRQITGDGLSSKVLRRGRGYGVAGQIRTLRILCVMGLVVEIRSDDEILFKLTDAGQRIIRSELAVDL